MNRKKKILAGALAAALLMSLLTIPAFATSGDVAGAVEQTWTSAQGQIKTVVNNVVFPVLDVILAVLFFVKVGASYFDYRKHGQFEFVYSILYKPCIFKAYRLLNVQTLCIFPCFCPYEPKQGKFFILRRLPYPAVLRKYASLPL